MKNLAPGALHTRPLAKHRLASSIVAALLCTVLVTGSVPSAFAQDTPEATVDAVTATEAPVEEITEVPVEEIPTDEIVTEEPVVELTDEPVVEPTLEATEAPTDVIETVAPTEPPTEEPTATETPTETPSPTPMSSLTSSLAAQPDCQLAPDSATTLAAGNTIDYLCIDRTTVSGANVSPAGVGVTWTIRVEAEGGWTVQVLPPVNPGEEQLWSDPGLATTIFAFTPLTPFGTDTAPATIDTQAEITYRVRISRPDATTCDTSPYALTFTRDATFSATDTTVTPSSTQDPYRLTPDLATVPVPTVSFAGPLDLGDVPLSADSSAAPVVKEGTLTVTVDGLDTTCGGWTLHLSGAGLTDADGTPMEGSALVITAIDDVPLASGDCLLADGCDLLTLDGGAGAPTTSTHTVRVELRMPEQPRTGSFRASVQAGLRAIASTAQG